MEKRTLVALAISFLVLGFYPVLLHKMYPDYYKKVASVPAAPASAGKTSKEAASGPVSALAEVLPPSKDLHFENKALRLTFNEKGGVIREISFIEFPDSEKNEPLKLISLDNTEGAVCSLRFADSARFKSPSVYQSQTSPQEIILTSQDSMPLKITKKFEFGDRYDARMSVTIENTSAVPQDLRYELTVGSTIPARHSIDGQYIESNFFSDVGGKNILRHIKETGQGKEVQSHGILQWAAVKDRHFSIILKPNATESFTGLVHGLGNHRAITSLLSPELNIPAHGSVRHDFLFYIGPNELEALPQELDDLINFGKLDAIGKVLVGALELLHKIFKNYGISIIALTILINLMLFPLTRVSYMSMKRMQLIQPQMLKLREQHKKNPDRLNRETMELYRKHKVNPFGGCLPMLIQMPVFIALYVALSKSVILINSKLLWIRDLSSPDSVHLPFSLPYLGNAIHVLPLLMTAAMFFQQKFTQIKMEGQDPAVESQQKMMSTFMPVIFCFIFYAMPSGLVLYWLTNTLLMTFYQLHLKKITLT